MKIVKNVEELKIVRIQIISKVIRWQKNHNLIKTLFTLQNYVDISSPPATNTFSFHLTTWREHSTHPIHTHFLDISFLLSPKKNNKFKASNKSFDSSKHTWRNSAPVWVYTSLNNPQSQENQSRSQNQNPNNQYAPRKKILFSKYSLQTNPKKEWTLYHWLFQTRATAENSMTCDMFNNHFKRINFLLSHFSHLPFTAPMHFHIDKK